MRMPTLFSRKGKLLGNIVIRDLPTVKTFAVSLTVFRVANASAPPPYRGTPPPEAYQDTISVKEFTDPEDHSLRFKIECAAGFYYLDVGVIAVRQGKKQLHAQVEHFFPTRQPTEIRPGRTHRIELAVQWPNTPLDELQFYGTIYPRGNDPSRS